MTATVMPDCPHAELIWRSASDQREALDEAAWVCLDCDTVLGLRPDLDRSHTEIKTHCIPLDFHELKLIYVSNGTMGLVIAENVAARCREQNRYDQWSILAFILDDRNLNTHGQFWQDRAREFAPA
ncbi:MAG: hypothetical protein E6J20_18710 [Chloroflexi bacterium]|nr:MAG: hypothetical protein E6J20_18710 [Chloroflexota bacterium]